VVQRRKKSYWNLLAARHFSTRDYFLKIAPGRMSSPRVIGGASEPTR
jgi:hypothetical protein